VLESIGAEKEQLKARLTMLRGVQPENEQKKNEWVELAEKLPGFPLRVAACIQRVGRSVMLLSPAQIISK
jgi:hypothetical protein